MKFYVVTPTYNALSWLQRCVRSVADQIAAGVEVHHHVQDGGSADGTPTWLDAWQRECRNISGYTFTYESAKDAGMYDAINTAWEKMPADADITAHLNSDEQYLPEALKGVADAFHNHSDAEIVLGTYIVVDAESRYICHRRPVRPGFLRSQTVCEIITCSCFHRVDVFLQHGIRFDTSYKALADMVFYRTIVAARPVFCVQPGLLTSVFTVTGENLAWSDRADKEWKKEMASLPRFVSKSHGLSYRISNLLRRFADWFTPAPENYGIYMPEQENRSLFRINHPTAHWGMRTVSTDNE